MPETYCTEALIAMATLSIVAGSATILSGLRRAFIVRQMQLRAGDSLVD